MTGRRSASVSALLLGILGLLTVFVGARAAAADDCVALGGTLSAGECRIAGAVSRSGSYAISTGLRITSTGSIVVPTLGPGLGNSLRLTVAGGVHLEAPAGGQATIDGSATGLAAIGATVTIVAGGDIVMDGAGSVGAQIRTSGNTSSASGCSATAPPSPVWGRAGDVTLTSTAGSITLGPGTKLTATGGCLGGAIELNTPSGSIDTRAAMLSKPGGTTTTAVVRGGPITLKSAGTLTVGPNSSIASQFTTTAGGAFNYGADRIHLESASNMLIQGLVQSLGGANFGTDVFGGQNLCTSASRIGKPATPTSCVELWVGGTLTVDGGDPSKPNNTINGSIIARSGQNGLANATDPSWIDAHVRGNVLLKGKPTAVGTNSFLLDAQQNSANARGGTISVHSYRGKVTASGRTFVADGATTDGGTGGLVTVEAAGPVDYPPLPSGQFHAADLNSNIDLGDSMQFARGANDGSVGGAGKIHFRSWNGQITGGPVAFLAPNTVVSLPAGTVVLPLVGVPITLAVSTPVTLGNSTYHGRQFVKSVDGASVALPAGAPITVAAVDATVAVDTVVTPPGGTIVNPSLTTLAGGCADRFTGAVLVDPTTGQQYPCDDRTGVVDGGGIGQTELIITLCEGWLYNGVTRPLATTSVHECGGRPTPPPDVVIPVAPTLQIFGGVYQYDGFERPARGTADSGFVDIGGGHRAAAVIPQAYGQAGPTEPLLPLPTVTYVDSSNNPVTVPIEVGTYTATAYFPGNDAYTPLTVTAPIIIFTQVPVVTVTGGIFRFDGQPHPATGVTTKDGSTQVDIVTPATVVYYNCVPNASLPSWTPATDSSCTTVPPVQWTTTHLPPNVTLNDADAGHWIPVVAYFPGNSSYGPTWATARIAIWRPRPSVTTATGGTFVYDGNPHATTTTVADGGTDGLGGTYPTQQNTVNPATWTFTDPVTGVINPSGVTYTGATSPLHAVNVQAPVVVGTYPVRAVYPGDAIHSGSTGTNTIIITPRPVTMTAIGGTIACDGATHAATGSLTSTNAAGQPLNLGSPVFTYTDSAGNVFSDPPSAAGTYLVTASLPQSLAGNYASTPATITATLTITSRTATINATGGTFVWDGLPHGVTATVTGTGVPSGTLAAVTYTKNGLPTGVPVDVGTYTATATLPTGLGCFTAATVTRTITITPRTAVITVTGGTYFYDGQTHLAIGTLTGTGIPSGAVPDISYTLSGSPTGTPVNVGVYTATATLPATWAASHTAAAATATVIIRARSCAPPTDGSVITIQYPWSTPVATTAYGVNTSGQIVGGFVDSTDRSRGFSQSAPGGTYGTPPIECTPLGATSTTAYGINTAGQIVGMYVDANGQSRGFMLTGSVNGVGGTHTAIDYPGATGTILYGINDSGKIVGAYLDGGNNSHGFTLTGITFAPTTGLPNLSGAVFRQVDATSLGASQTVLYGINNTGRVVGAYVDDNADPVLRKFRGFSVTFASTDVSNLTGATFASIAYPGAVETWAHGINDSGVIVGNWDDSDGIAHGFLLEGQSYTTLDVGECGTTALCINNDGDVCGGYQCDKPGGDCGFVIPKTPPTDMCETVNGVETPVGTLMVQPQPNGNVRIVYTQSLAVTDTTYGTGASTDWGSKGRLFKALTNSDKAEFRFKNGAGAVVLEFAVDYITASSSHPSGYGTLGVSGGDGGMISGSASNIAFMDTSITANLNQSPEFHGFTVNSPSPLSAFPKWEVRSIYTVEVKAAAFGPSGFGSVTIPLVHNSAPKQGMPDPVSPVACPVTTPPPPPPPPPPPTGQAFTTYTQGGWGSKPNGNNPGKLLSTKFATVYPGGSVSIGGTKKLTFTSASAIEKFLPQGGTASVLTSNATNPTSSSAGVFAGQVMALQLSVDFSKAGITRTGLGNLAVVSGPLAGHTVTAVLSLANTVIGGNTGALPSGLTVSGLNAIVDAINNNFDNGTTDNHYLQ